MNPKDGSFSHAFAAALLADKAPRQTPCRRETEDSERRLQSTGCAFIALRKKRQRDKDKKDKEKGHGDGRTKITQIKVSCQAACCEEKESENKCDIEETEEQAKPHMLSIKRADK